MESDQLRKEGLHVGHYGPLLNLLSLEYTASTLWTAKQSTFYYVPANCTCLSPITFRGLYRYHLRCC